MQLSTSTAGYAFIIQITPADGGPSNVWIPFDQEGRHKNVLAFVLAAKNSGDLRQK